MYAGREKKRSARERKNTSSMASTFFLLISFARGSQKKKLWNFVQVLDLSGNQLSGSFATANINMIPSLQILAIADNRLQGDVPDFSMSTNLNFADLSNNLLVGEIDTKFGNNTVSVDFHDNRQERSSLVLSSIL